MKEEINFEGYFVSSEIDIAKYCVEKFGTIWKRKWEEPLVIEFVNSKVYIFSFGSVVFQNADEKLKKEVFKELKKYLVEKKEKINYESFKLFVFDSKKEIEEFLKKQIDKDFFFVTEEGGVILKEKLSKKVVEMIAFVIAQAVALRYIEDEVDNAVDSVEETLEKFRKSILILSTKRAVDYLFEVSSIKNRIISDLMLLEAPEITWEEEELARVYSQMRDYFDIKSSIKVVENKLSYISETSTHITSILAERRAEILEIIIIVLIIVEILLGLFR